MHCHPSFWLISDLIVSILLIRLVVKYLITHNLCSFHQLPIHSLSSKGTNPNV